MFLNLKLDVSALTFESTLHMRVYASSGAQRVHRGH